MKTDDPHQTNDHHQPGPGYSNGQRAIIERLAREICQAQRERRLVTIVVQVNGKICSVSVAKNSGVVDLT